MGAANGCSTAAWVLPVAFLKPPKECNTDFQEPLKKLFGSPLQLITAVAEHSKTVQRNLRNSEAFCKYYTIELVN